MSAGDNTRDDRWRPGFASSERRVREELDDATAEAERRVFSRELSFVPSQTTPKFEAHDPQTRALIAEHKRLEQLRHGGAVRDRLEEWKLMDAFQGAREKQAYLEPLIEAVRRDPIAHEDKLISSSSRWSRFGAASAELSSRARRGQPLRRCRLA